MPHLRVIGNTVEACSDPGSLREGIFFFFNQNTDGYTFLKVHINFAKTGCSFVCWKWVFRLSTPIRRRFSGMLPPGPRRYEKSPGPSSVMACSSALVNIKTRKINAPGWFRREGSTAWLVVELTAGFPLSRETFPQRGWQPPFRSRIPPFSRVWSQKYYWALGDNIPGTTACPPTLPNHASV